MGKAARAPKALRPFPKTVPECDDVVVAILTGGRPSLLASTLRDLEAYAGNRVNRWLGVALVNGGDEASRGVLASHTWIRVESRPGELRKIGPAASELMELAAQSGPRFVLHLEDDWGCRSAPETWLDRAAFALQDLQVGQVRLRLAAEKVMRVSMSTGSRIHWLKARDHERSRNAHLTFNPNLMRAADCVRVYPCSDEPDAQLRFATLGLDVVQLVPGAFSHLGDTMSLRESIRDGEH